MQSFSGGKLNALSTAFSSVYRLDRLLPALSSRQFNREHPFPRAPRYRLTCAGQSQMDSRCRQKTGAARPSTRSEIGNPYPIGAVGDCDFVVTVTKVAVEEDLLYHAT
jgi:hypothetical protein